MAFKVDVRTKRSVKPDAAQEITTRVSITGDTAEEAGEIHGILEALRSQGYPQFDPSVPALPSPSETEEEADPLARGEPVEPRAEFAEERGQEALVSPSPGTPPPPQATEGAERSLALQQAVSSYLVAMATTGLSPVSINSYRRVLEACMEKVGGDAPLSSIDEATISEYLAVVGERVSKSSMTTYMTILKTFFNWQVRQHNLETSPMAGIKLRTPHWKPVAPFSDDELRRLIGATETPLERAVIVLLADTGMRAGELSGLKLVQVDQKQGLIRVDGKGDKMRTLSLNDRPRQALETYLATRTQQDGLIWPEGWNRQSIAYLLKKLGQRANVPHVYPHRFRHTFASRFLAQTGDALALKVLLGHSSLGMTQRYTAAAEGDRALDVHAEHSPLDALA